jgi:hypothetical protein
MEIEFKLSKLIPSGAYIHNYLDLNDKYFKSLGQVGLIVTQDPNYEEAAVQLQIIEAADKLMKCEGCDETWLVDGSLNSWYHSFNSWVKQG